MHWHLRVVVSPYVPVGNAKRLRGAVSTHGVTDAANSCGGSFLNSMKAETTLDVIANKARSSAKPILPSMNN